MSFQNALSRTVSFFFVLLSGFTYSIEIDPNKFDIYFGDINGDGKNNDVYFHGVDQFVLIHGDIITPILTGSEDSFAFYEDGDGSADYIELDDSILASYTKGVFDVDYFNTDIDGDGVLDIAVSLLMRVLMGSLNKASSSSLAEDSSSISFR